MQLRSLQSYLAALEAELAIWRSGKCVYNVILIILICFLKGEKVPVDKQVLDKSRISSTVIKDSPSAVESSPTLVTSPDEKQSTGSINVIAEDEREEYLRRENELMDQLAEKECELEQLQKIIESLETELKDIKQREQSVTQVLLYYYTSHNQHVIETHREFVKVCFTGTSS